MRGSRESLLKVKDQYYWPPSNNKFKSVAFYTETTVFFFNKTTYLYKVVTCTKPSPSVRFP